jgi:glycosyltransferase involved in cell wall biosynthesis
MNIDVIIPIYNQSIYLSQAIESCLRQGILKKNIFVVDDCSLDNPEVIARKYGVTFIKTEYNLGPAAARNLGIKSSNSDLISFLDADDVMLPGRILESINILFNSDSKMVCGNYRIWVNRISLTAPFYKNPIIVDYNNLIKKNYVASGSVTLKRDVLDNIGLFNEEYRLAEDYDLWLRISEKYSISYIHNPLYLYHRDTINKKSLTSNPKNLDILLSNIDKIKKASKERTS